jgi:hypothetical protein
MKLGDRTLTKAEIMLKDRHAVREVIGRLSFEDIMDSVRRSRSKEEQGDPVTFSEFVGRLQSNLDYYEANKHKYEHVVVEAEYGYDYEEVILFNLREESDLEYTKRMEKRSKYLDADREKNKEKLKKALDLFNDPEEVLRELREETST